MEADSSDSFPHNLIRINKDQVYLAGPFFNTEQIAWMEWLEGICEKYEIPYFSPRLHATKLDDNPSLENRKAVFESDVKGWFSSKLILASLDWLLPENDIIMQVSKNKSTHYCVNKLWDGDELSTEYITDNNKDLNLPDPGTVFETGMTYGYNLAMQMMAQQNQKYLVGYITKPTPLVNLMLTDSVSGILPDKHAIEVFLKSWIKYPIERENLIKDTAKIYKWQGASQ